MHIPPHDNDNKPIIDINDSKVPYAFFNRVTLNRDEEFVYELKEYESCIVPVTAVSYTHLTLPTTEYV